MESTYRDGDDRARPVRPSRRAFLAAYAVPLCLLPSSLWRAHLALSTDFSYAWYLLTLSVVEMSLGLLTLGLVHRWGEVLPRWVPFRGGHRIPVRAAVIPASVGAVAVTLIVAFGALNWAFDLTTPDTVEEARQLSAFSVPSDADLERPGGWVGAAYAPLLAWGPLLGAVTVAYYRRRVDAAGQLRPAPAPRAACTPRPSRGRTSAR
jgi:hypothetical protein